MIGDVVKVTMDRPLGSEHPVYAFIYPINYGYVEGILAGDGEFQDAYVLGVNEAVDEFEGEVIAVIRRKDDVEEKWVVAPKGVKFTKEEIEKETWFQEQWFLSEVILED
ncbi:inorganic pyrophosphatase [Anaerorhabdus sp.]|uniref:inorganic pyrophosphatase n=1 Tax=Anaerorhabdus sp. TaxID=1872524 RepID=UPI002FC9920D